MTLAAAPFVNYNNVFVVLQTTKAYQFPNENEMKSFMQYAFPDPTTTPNSAYCMQTLGDLRKFECLLIYSYGVPNRQFDVNFSYNYRGDTGFLVAKIDPLASSIQTRSLR